LVQAGKDAATAMAARSPARADMRDIIDPAANDVLTRMIDEASTAGVAADLARPAEQLATLAKTNPSSLTMSDVLRIRRGAEDVADPVFAAAKKPGGPGRVAPGTEASTARSIAGAAQRVLEQEHNLGKAFADLNRQTQARALVSRAVDDAAVRPHGLANVLSMGVGAGTSGGDPVEAIKRGLMMRALLSQSALGAGALVAARTPAANIARSGDILLKLLGATTHDDPR
jgi:hypothetical protein